MLSNYKKAIGRAHFFLNSIRHFSQHNNKPCYVTCSGKVDGVGAQVHAVLSTMSFAERMGFTYVHTPFKEIEHNIGNEIFWENYFGLGSNEIKAESVYESHISRRKLSLNKPWRVESNNLYEIEHCHSYADLYPESYSNVMSKVRLRRSLDYDGLLGNEENKIRVSLHVRRGDVARSGGNSFRFTQSNIILNTILKMKKCFLEAGLSGDFKLFSQGVPADFENFEKEGVKLFLNYNLFETVSELITADVLLMSKSSLSYTAALYSQGIILYEPFWHAPLKNWLILNPDGSFDRQDFRAKLMVFR